MTGLSDWWASVQADPFSVQGYLMVYGIFALTHLLVQYTFALLHDVRVRQLERSKASHRRGSAGSPIPDEIVVWVPVFQEKPKWLEACLYALEIAAVYFEQTVPGSKVTIIVVDDGSYLGRLKQYSQPAPPLTRGRRFWLWARGRKPETSAQRQERYSEYRRKRWELEAILIRYASRPHFEIPKPSGQNVGKRHVQEIAWLLWMERVKAGLARAAKLYVTVDSDTVLDENAIYRIALNFRNPDVGAATGYVDVGNWADNWLSRLIDMRYWSAFHVERAAQSFWRCVMCCSGPLAAYKADVADLVMDMYTNQMFRGNRCTFGDDRHLTNLILEKGYEVVMDPTAHCLTDVPTKVLKEYLPQQKRWSMSFYREMLWSLEGLKSHSGYMTYDLFMQFLLPFMLLGGLAVTGYLAYTGDAWTTIGLYVVTIFAVGFIRSLYPFFARRAAPGQTFSLTRRFSQLLFMGYGVLHVLVLIPIRIIALISLLRGTTAWGTRTG